ARSRPSWAWCTRSRTRWWTPRPGARIHAPWTGAGTRCWRRRAHTGARSCGCAPRRSRARGCRARSRAGGSARWTWSRSPPCCAARPSCRVAARSSRAGAVDRLAWLLIALAALVAYAPSLGGAFVFDDLLRIPRNPWLRSLWPPWAPLLHTSRPLTQWTLALNYAWGGLAPRGYHALNLAIHALAALALAWLARLTLERALP